MTHGLIASAAVRPKVPKDAKSPFVRNTSLLSRQAWAVAKIRRHYHAYFARNESSGIENTFLLHRVLSEYLILEEKKKREDVLQILKLQRVKLCMSGARSGDSILKQSMGLERLKGRGRRSYCPYISSRDGCLQKWKTWAVMLRSLRKKLSLTLSARQKSAGSMGSSAPAVSKASTDAFLFV